MAHLDFVLAGMLIAGARQFHPGAQFRPNLLAALVKPAVLILKCGDLGQGLGGALHSDDTALRRNRPAAGFGLEPGVVSSDTRNCPPGDTKN